MVKAKVSKKKTVASLLLICLFLVSALVLSAPQTKAKANSYLTVDLAQQMQQMDGWGTSLCWWADAVGGWDMEGTSGKTKREEISDYVFGTDGLNLNIVRYNIPGGDDPEHNHMVDNRGLAPLKETSVSPYNWDNGKNQFWILQQADKIRKAQEDLIVETFNNSPPFWMTESGCASGNVSKNDENLARENYEQFAVYYADVVNYIQNTLGVNVDYVEAMNEPGSAYWGAMGSQEGNKVNQGESQSMLIKAVYNELESRGAFDGGLKMTAPDETNPGLAYSSYNKLDGEAKAMLDKINYHIYSKSDNDRKNIRSLSYDSENVQNQKLWQSEICYGSTTDKTDADNPNSMTNVFELANDIYKDLYIANVNAWVIWQAVESDLSNMTYGNNYGLIHGVYQEPGNNEYGIDMDGLAINRGDYHITKQYYAMGQYSKYIKAGYKIVKSPVADSVIAVSPSMDEVVIVRSNSKDYDENESFYLKGFDIESATKIVTDADNNWAESSVKANGSYVSNNFSKESITTLVLKGKPASVSAESGIFFNSFVSRNSVLKADFYATDATASYKLFYSDDKALLPVFGGVGAEQLTLSVTAANKDYSVSIKGKNRDRYYAVIEATKDDKAYYSTVLEAVSERLQGGEFTYFTSAGRQNKLSLDGTFASFSENFGIADRPFGADDFTGKMWGFTSLNTGEYTSNDLFNSLRYSNTSELEYKYEVEQNASYNVVLGFKDAWGVKNRTMQLWINGTDTGKTVTNTHEFKALAEAAVSGTMDTDGKYYITVTLKRDNSTNQNPAVNFISLQETGEVEIAYGVESFNAVNVNQGETIASVLPTNINLVTSQGVKSVSDYTVEKIDYLTALAKGGGQAVVYAKENAHGKEFSFSVATIDATEKIYYYVDSGNLDPTSASLDAFGVIKNSNDTLINTDSMDKYSSGGTWGRLNGETKYVDHWANDNDKMTSIIEGKFTSGSGATAKTHIQYLLSGLEAGDYIVEVGCDIKNWDSTKRDLTIMMGSTELGKKSGYNGVNLWTFDYTKADSADVIFDVYTEGTGRANPVVSYAIVKKVFAVEGLRLKTPVIPAVINSHDTSLTVSNLDEGALLTLTDENGMLIGEHKVTAQDVANGSVVLNGLNFSSSSKVEAKQFKSAATSGVGIADVPQVGLSVPRIVWSSADDVITIEAKSESGIQSIAYKQGENGKWQDIKDKKFFRADKNGSYFVKMVTRANVEIIEEIVITHVDLIEMKIDNDLTKWTDENLQLSFNFEDSLNAINKVVVFENGKQVDISGTANAEKFFYTVSENCELRVLATSDKGSVKSFDVAVGTIDKNAAKISASLSRKDGVDVINISSISLGNVNYMWSYNGGEYSKLYGNEKPLVKNGTYKFKMENMLGRSDEITVIYSTKFTDDGIAKASFKQMDKAVRASFELPYGYIGAEVVRLDGKGGSITVENGYADITENGEYALVAHKENGDLIMTSFMVENADKAQADAGGCGSITLGDSGIGGALLLVISAVAAISVLFIRRKSYAK